MTFAIDANMRMLIDRMDIPTSRMTEEYGLSTVDEIIEAEAAQGNMKAVRYAQEYYSSPEKLIELFKLMNVENRYSIIENMDEETRLKLLPYLDNEDLVMGLYFFSTEKLLAMLMKVDTEELVRVCIEAFGFEQMMQLFTEEDLAMFFMNKDLEKEIVLSSMRELPPDIMQKFIENVTGMPAIETEPMELITDIGRLPDDKFRKFMAGIDPDVQRQLVYQLSKDDPSNLTMFPNITYVNMLSKLMKQDMVPPMVMLEKDTLIDMVTELPPNMMSIVAAQIDEKEFAKFLQDGHMDLLENAMIF